MAALLERELGSKANLVEGGLGEFSVLVGDRLVVKKGLIFFPTDRKVLAAVRKELVMGQSKTPGTNDGLKP